MNNENNIAPINEDLNVVEYEIEDIKSLIYTIRGKQVMLDSDVARLYKYETKNVNKAMKRNIDRFPEDFCFQINDEEMNSLRFQNGTLKNQNGRGQHVKYLPYVYTEQGVAMLSGLLKNEIAIQVSIKIIRAFIEMRKFLSSNGQVFERLTNIESKLLEQDKNINELFAKFDKKEQINQRIFFKGQIWDSYELIIDIIKTAQNKILIIDNYIDDTILKMLQKKNKNVEVVILTLQNCTITKLDIKKFNEQYPTLKIATTNKFHDRFIIIDNKDLYHCGASLKDLGKKCFAISKIDDDGILKRLNENIIFQ
ncbi:MAG: ORF6N domain-containing protein [Clostridia bacterium]|nr:ORF6N domain-containing protein [Clostridia bacterium]